MYVRKFSRLTARAAALALALVCARAQAAAPSLPPSAIADDTFVVIHINVAQMSPESVEASAKALLGPQAAMAAEGLAKYKEKYTEYTAAGAEAATVVMSGDPNAAKPEPVVYLKVKAGADADGLLKKIQADQAKEGKGNETDTTKEGDFLVMRQKGSAAAGAASPERAKIFADILGGAEKALTIAFIPTDKIRTKMKEDIKKDQTQPPWVAALGQSLSDSKWLLMDAKLGDSPMIGLTVEAADEAGAKGIADGVTQGSAQLKAQADQMKAGGPQFAPMAESLNGIADALKPTQAGSKVSLNIDGKAIAPAVANFLPFMMMGGAGGPPKPAAPPGAGN